MHRFLLSLLVIAVLHLPFLDTRTYEAVEEHAPTIQPVNAVVGDAGFVAAFGRAPDEHVSEKLRIKSHLAYVEQLLSRRTTDHLSQDQRQRRASAMRHLREYWETEVFPRNTTHSGRRTPVFIDEAGRICAVGYLVEQTAGRDMAETIGQRYRYARIQEMDLPELNRWADRQGLSLRELAMIQPEYCWSHPDAPECGGTTDNMNKTAEMALIGANVSTAMLNGWMVRRNQRSLLSAGAGLISGVAGLAVGLSDRANYETTDLVFAGVSLALSGWNILQRNRPHAAYAVQPVWMTHGTESMLGVGAVWEF